MVGAKIPHHEVMAVADAPNIRHRERPVQTTRHFPTAKSDTAEHNVEVRLKEYVNTQSIDDPYEGQYMLGGAVGGALDVLAPPYNFHALARLPYENSTLLGCISAMVTNCHGHGWYLEYTGPDGQQDGSEAQAEKATLEKLLNYPNGDYSLQDLCERARFDKEAMGNFYIEVARDRKGRITSMHHIPAQTMRRTTRDRDEVEVEIKLPREGSDFSKVKKRFCRFVQLVGDKKVYFKEFGDPRRIDPKTGLEKPGLSVQDQATEIIHGAIYYPTSPYGVPRWINQLPSILGSRQAELTNYDYFKDNAVPAMAVLVSGGMLTQNTLDGIEDHLTAIKGRRSIHRMVFIEAQGDENLANDNGQVPVPRLELKPLRDAQQNDALFEKYEEACETKTRASFRLPPLLVGRSQDITFASAQTSYEVSEGQMFGPERGAFDDGVMNMKVLASYDSKYWSFKSHAPKLTDPKAVVDALKEFDSMGAMTPNIAIRLANEYFDLDIEDIPDDWGNWPFEIVKQQAMNGTLKGIEQIGQNIDDKINEKPDATVPVDSDADELPDEIKTKVAVAKALGDLRDIIKQGANAKPVAA